MGAQVVEEQDNLVLELLRGLRADIGGLKGDVAGVQSRLEDMATKSDLQSLRADVASDPHTMRRDTGEQIVGLRRAVMEYHSTVVGHGTLNS